jgi:hypothetical protein
MTEEADNWKPLYGNSGHYNVCELISESIAMDAIRTMFPKGKESVNEMNFILFSTSGVHGTYCTIEDAEADSELSITFLIVHPRLVTLKYGNVTPETKEDFKFLKGLRKASWKVVTNIGA